jgi:glucokinase
LRSFAVYAAQDDVRRLYHLFVTARATVLAGDIGGTKTLLRYVDGAGATLTEQRYESGAFPTFEAMITDFLARCGAGAAAASSCFAVAGPVIGRRAQITNLVWSVDADLLERTFPIGRVTLINDFYAVAVGVPLLQTSDLLMLQEGRRNPTAPIAILGAGTGLGEAMITHDNGQWSVLPGEGGHADFAPQDEEQARLFLYLLSRYGHVSWERVLSGMGLVNIYNFLTGTWREYDEALPAAIARLADEGDPKAVHAFEMFVDIYGAEAGNMAVRVLARGGVFVAGGVAAKNTRHFTDGRFAESFVRKGRFRELLREMPVALITNPSVGLLGAVAMAKRAAG